MVYTYRFENPGKAHIFVGYNYYYMFTKPETKNININYV